MLWKLVLMVLVTLFLIIVHSIAAAGETALTLQSPLNRLVLAFLVLDPLGNPVTRENSPQCQHLHP